MLQQEPWYRISVRPIRIDPMEIEHAAGLLWQEMLDVLRSDYPRPDSTLPLDKTLWAPNWGPKIKVKNLAGKSLSVPITIQMRPAEIVQLPDGYATFAGANLGGYLRLTAPLVLAVVINFGGLPATLVKKLLQDKATEFQEEFRSIISHELTHAKDFLTKPQYDQPGDSPETYFNDPMEVRAFMQQIARDVLNSIGEFKGMPITQAVGKALERSRVWGEMNHFLSPENRKKILQGIVMHLSDRGFGS